MLGGIVLWKIKEKTREIGDTKQVKNAPFEIFSTHCVSGVHESKWKLSSATDFTVLLGLEKYKTTQIVHMQQS